MADFSAFSLWVFVTILLLAFSFVLLLAGAFTAYFGSGKSRKIGAGLLVGGLALGILWILLAGSTNFINVGLVEVIVQSIGVLLAAFLGAGAAIGLFLLAIMKS